VDVGVVEHNVEAYRAITGNFATRFVKKGTTGCGDDGKRI
jgi:hypothetical protein